MKISTLLLMLLGTTASGYWLNPKVVDEPRQTTMTTDIARGRNCENNLKILIRIVCDDQCIKGTYEKIANYACNSGATLVWIKDTCCP